MVGELIPEGITSPVVSTSMFPSTIVDIVIFMNFTIWLASKPGSISYQRYLDYKPTTILKCPVPGQKNGSC